MRLSRLIPLVAALALTAPAAAQSNKKILVTDSTNRVKSGLPSGFPRMTAAGTLNDSATFAGCDSTPPLATACQVRTATVAELRKAIGTSGKGSLADTVTLGARNGATATSQAAHDSSAKIATTLYVDRAASSAPHALLADTVTAGARNGATATTQSAKDSSAKIATTSYVDQAVNAGTGSWTPAVGGSATYTAQSGRYIRIGNLVQIQGDMTINAIGTGSQSTISGLPFTANSANPGSGCTIHYFSGLASNVVYISASISNNTSTVVLNSIAAAGATITNGSNLLTSSSRVAFSCTYSR